MESTSSCTRTLHVAVAQVHSGGGLAQTLGRIERQVASAAAVGCELILFAEGVLQGYDYGMTRESVRALAEPLDGPGCRQLAAMARQFGLVLLCGFLERDGDAVHNSVLVADADGRTRAVRKHLLTPGELAAGITAGPRERGIVEINGVRCAIIICADGGIDSLHEHLRQQGVDYRLCPTGGGGKRADMLHEAQLLTEEGLRRYVENRPRVFKTEAVLSETECPYTGFASANALGPVGEETCHQGHCMIVDANRVMRAQIPGTNVLEHMQDQMVHAELRFR